EDSAADLLYASLVVITVGNRGWSRVSAHKLAKLFTQFFQGSTGGQSPRPQLLRKEHLWVVQDCFFLCDASLGVEDAHRPAHQFAASVANLNFGRPVVFIENRGSSAAARQIRCHIGDLEG